MPRPKATKDHQFNVRTDLATMEQIRLAASKERRTETDWIRRAIEVALSKGAAPPTGPSDADVLLSWIRQRPREYVEVAMRTAALPGELPPHIRALLDRLRGK